MVLFPTMGKIRFRFGGFFLNFRIHFSRDFFLKTHNGSCAASQSMHAARQLRAESTLLEFAYGSSFSQDTPGCPQVAASTGQPILIYVIKCSSVKKDGKTSL